MQTIQPMIRYSKAKIFNGTVHLCGQFSSDLSKDVKDQSVDTFAQVDALLEECGTDKSKVISVMVHLNDIDKDYSEFNEAYEAWISGEEPPVRTCVQAKMFSEQCLVELTIVAAK